MNDLTSLKAEIQGDPVGLSYGTWATTADDLRIHQIMSDPTRRPIGTVAVPSWKIVNCFDAAEFATLTVLQCSALTVVLSAGQVDLASAAVRAILANIFPVGGGTRTALVALWNAQTNKRSRLQEIGWFVTVDDITAARG